MVQLREEDPCLTPAVQIFTQSTRVCFNTRSEWRGVCTCAIAVRVRVCAHFCVLVSMAAADQAGACRGPPLLRLRALNGADGRFPFAPLQAPPPGRPPPSFERSGAQNPTSHVAALPRSLSPRGERLQLPFLGAPCWVWAVAACFRLPEGGEGSFPGEARPWMRCLPHVQFPRAPPPLTTCPQPSGAS